MLKRREFILQSVVCMTALPILPILMLPTPLRPLKAEKRPRKLLVRHEPDGRCLIVSDGLAAPRDLIRPAVIDRVFGTGVYDSLSQPDHWRMIDAGWFAGEDLFTPVPQGDRAYQDWCSWHRPEVEAHDLLLATFSDRYSGPFGLFIADCGLTLAEHPSTPRYATARVAHPWFLTELAKHVAARTKLLHCAFGSPSSSVGPDECEPVQHPKNSKGGMQHVKYP